MAFDFPPGDDTPPAGLPTTRRQAREQAGRPYRTDRAATGPSGVRAPARATSTSAPSTPSARPARPATQPQTRRERPGGRPPATAPALPSTPAGPGRRSSLLLAAVVALVGAVLVVVGSLQATVFKPAAVTTATLSAPGTPVVSTAVGVLKLDGPRVTVTATGPGAVFIGIGRAADVDAYLASGARQEVVGQKDGKLLTHKQGSQSTLPDPGGVDVWVVSTRATGKATLTWPDTSGQWRLVVAGDGGSAAPATTFTWSGRTSHSKAPQLISIGLVLAIGGLITLIVLFSRSRMTSDDDEEDLA